jgi:TetR/AcrR family transcriptional regulator, fatty acid metabolism regulator protein
MQDVAETAEVSKGLIHYHFHDKEALLARLVTWLTDQVTDRERVALADTAPARAVDALWEWLDGELARGDIRVLLDLAHAHGDLVRQAVRVSARERRVAAATTVQTLFATLGLQPRIPAPLLAEVVVAFIDGLALDAAVASGGNPRVAFDVFWLSLLSLAE